MTDREKVVRAAGRRLDDLARLAIVRSSAEREERYLQLVELAPDTILIHDGERIILANAAAVRLAGATHRDQLVGQPIDSFLHPPYLKAVEAQLLGSGDMVKRVPPVRDAFRRLDGTEVEVEVTAIAFLDHGRPSAHLVVHDITERLGLQAGDRIAFIEMEQGYLMIARNRPVDILFGSLAEFAIPGTTIEDYDDAVGEGISDDVEGPIHPAGESGA